MRKLLLWLVMVALMVAVILGGTGWFLYSRAGEANFPREAVTFGGVELAPNGYDWTVPVLGDVLKKNLQNPVNLTVQNLGDFVETPPTLALPAWATGAEIDITAPDGKTWYGTATTCNNYGYTQNGTYELVLKVRHEENQPPADAQGWFSYRAAYTVTIPPEVTLSSTRAAQGSVVALELSGILDGEPALQTDLGTVWFRKTASGYMGYIPVTYNAESGDHPLQLTCGSVSETLTLTVTKAQTTTVSLPATETVGGETEFQNAIWPLYTASENEKLWTGPFKNPVQSEPTVTYGSVQLFDGERGGQATALTYTAESGSEIIAPQAGKIVYAGALALTGNTVVIEHGCGVKSYLLGMGTIAVTAGQTVQAGEPVGAMGESGELHFEMRIGNKSVDPIPTIRGNSGLQYHEG